MRLSGRVTDDVEDGEHKHMARHANAIPQNAMDARP